MAGEVDDFLFVLPTIPSRQPLTLEEDPTSMMMFSSHVTNTVLKIFCMQSSCDCRKSVGCPLRMCCMFGCVTLH